MDKKVEDKMVQQIEKSLSSNMNDNLFLTGKIFDKEKLPSKSSEHTSREALTTSKNHQSSTPLVSLDYNDQSANLSRAEFIRQARESCLRQLSAVQSTARAYDSYYLDSYPQGLEPVNQRKAKPLRLFHDGLAGEDGIREEANSQEIVAFRYLIIRTVCAIILFLSIFIIDKFDLKIGEFTPDKIQEYVTGNDTLKDLENIMVTWLKD